MRPNEILMTAHATEAGSLDLVISDGDLALGDTLALDQWLALMQHRGENHQHPLIGAGCDDMVADNDQRYWQRQMVETLKRTGMKVRSIRLDLMNQKLDIDAKY